MSIRMEDNDAPVKLYLVRVSPCCRVVWLYMLQHKIPFELADVDVFHGEHRHANFVEMNPHEELPILVDGTTTVFGGLPILRYLSHKYTDFAGWGRTPEERYNVQSVLDWASTKLLNAVGYKLVYPQLLDRYHLGEEAGTELLVEKGIAQTCELLEALENFYLGHDAFLCGAEPTVADSYVATILCQTDWVDFDFKLWPRVCTWLPKVMSQEHWSDVHVQHSDYLQRLKKIPSTQYDES